MFKTLNGKVSAVYIGLVTLTALVCCVSVAALVYLERSLDGLMTDNYRSISAASRMSQALELQNNAALDYITAGDTADISGFYDSESEFETAYDAARHNVTEKGERDVVNAINADYSAYKKAFALLQLADDRQGAHAARSVYVASVKPPLLKLRTEIRELSDINERAMFNSKSRASGNARTAVFGFLLLSLAAVLGGAFASRFFVKRFMHPLNTLTDSISRVRAGELGFAINIKTNDETGKLAREFNDMLGRLNAYEQSTMGSLMSERNRIVAIVKSISDPLVVLDNDYRFLLVNNACEELFGIKEAEVLGRHFLEAIHVDGLFDILAGGADGGTNHAEDVISIEQCGRTGYYNAVVTPVTGVAGSTGAVHSTDAVHGTGGCILLMQNVTRIKELERVRTDFFAAASHEFKTPLTSIIMGASMLADGGCGSLNGSQREIVAAIEEDGENLSHFVGELLEVSKIESETGVYNMVGCAVNAIAENSCRQFTALASRKGVLLQNNIKDEMYVRCDFEKITWVINNLLSNALKYTHEGDIITVSAKRDEDSVQFSVDDTGIGIPDEYKERIFEKYAQFSPPDAEVRGSGLGLSVAREIITAHGGKIWVQSKSGSGSTFVFTLPLNNQ